MVKFSQLFTKTRKEAPKDEVSKNAQLLIKAGFINKEMAGVYTYLPLGLRVLKKIENIIREEMNAIGGQEILMTTLQDPRVWQKSGRWQDDVVDNWFKTKLASGAELGIASTHEEPLCELLKQYIRSYNDLPLYTYQIQTKFRNELRAKSGLMRGREFLMKDMYSFNVSEEDFKEFYEKCAEAYMRIFKRVGIGHLVWRTFASGGSFSKFSDEFQALSSAGEDIIYIDRDKKIAINREVYTEDILLELGLDKGGLEEAKAIEVGNIFPLGTRFPEAIGLTYKDAQGKIHYPIMGSYGIGLGRVLGTVVEVLSDEKGIIWPEAISPFDYHIVSIGGEDVGVKIEKLIIELEKKNIDVLYDDRDVSPGVKFSDADLIGVSQQIIISANTLAKGDMMEIKNRERGEVKEVKISEFISSVECGE